MELEKFVLLQRRARGWNQEELANRAQVTRMTIYRIEAGENVNVLTAEKILAALGFALPEPVKIEGWEP